MITLYNEIHIHLGLTHLQYLLPHTSTAVRIVITVPAHATSNFFNSRIILTIPTAAATYTRPFFIADGLRFGRRMLTSYILSTCSIWFMSLWYAYIMFFVSGVVLQY